MAQTPPEPATFRWFALAIWLPAAIFVGLLVGLAAYEVERFRSPVVLFSIAVGLALGATLVGLSRLLETGHRRTILVGTLLAVLAAVGCQHNLAYRSALAKAQKDLATFQLAKSAFKSDVLGSQPVPPGDLWEFMRWRAARGIDLIGRRFQGAAVWGFWTTDLLLKLAAAVGIVLSASRQSYCSQCNSWFRSTRRGRLDAETARTIAQAAGLNGIDPIESARYRIVSCRSGCGPTGFELCWNKLDGSSATDRVWLGTAERNRIAAVLDAPGDSVG